MSNELVALQIASGDTLMRQGEPGDTAYVLVHGRLQVTVRQPDGTQIEVDELHAPAIVGELALITGQPRSATITALEPSSLVGLSRAAWDRLGAGHPEALTALANSVAPRLRRTHLVDALRKLFGAVGGEQLRDIEAALSWRRLLAGETLFREGEPGDTLAIVVTGRLRAVQEVDGVARTLVELGSGEWSGEHSLLTGRPHPATVIAQRDSDVALLDVATFDRLAAADPGIMRRLARGVLDRPLFAANRQPSRATSFTLLPSGPQAPLMEAAGRLVEALSRLGPTLLLSAERVDAMLGRSGVAELPGEHPSSVALHAWLMEQEAAHAHVVYVADFEWSAWSSRCARQADRLVLVAAAGDDPAPGRLEQAVEDAIARVELLLVQRDDTPSPAGTDEWLRRRRVHTHHHVRPGVRGDWDRAARRLTGRALGLVLSGGGARGFAHVGVLRAASEAGLEWDIVGGTSMGALLGGAFACGLSSAALVDLATQFGSRRHLLDYTLPIVALTSSRKVTALYNHLFGETRVEDLWSPYFAVSTNLTRAEPVIHTRGPMAAIVRSSTSIPGVFSPTLRDGNVLVDGGIMNNFPLDIMREQFEAGEIVGINAYAHSERQPSYRFDDTVDGWRALQSRIQRSDKVRAPTLLNNMWRASEVNSSRRSRSREFRALADLIVDLPVGAYRSLEFDRYAELIELGYRTGQEQFAAWIATRER